MTNKTTEIQLREELAKNLKSVKNFFGGNEEKTRKFMTSVLYCSRVTPGLLECSSASIIEAFLKCAEYNLFPSSVSGEAYILPYKSKAGTVAQFQLGYQGIITLLYRAGIKKINTDIVRKNDDFSIESGLEPNLYHKYSNTERGEAVGVYAIVSLGDNQILFKYLSKDEIGEFKKFSKSINSTFSPWNINNDPQLHMWRKTAIKQLAKNLPKNEEAFSAFDDDNEDGDIKEYQKRALLEQAQRPTEDASRILGNLISNNEKNGNTDGSI